MDATAQVFNEDCIAGMAERISSSTVDLTVTSIPFEELCTRGLPASVTPEDLFVYSGKLEDVGNNGSTIDVREGRFALNMRFVAAELFRVHRPGTNVCIHIQQLLAYKNQHGFMGRRDFRGAMVDVFGAAGFHFYGEVAIPKDPQQMASRLNLHSLQFVTGYGRDANKLAPAPNDFVLIFQKPGESPYPVKCLKQLRKNPLGWVTTEEWIKWARGTWEDIPQMDILDGWRSAREHDEEKHVCPLQLELIRRFVMLYTNPISEQENVTVLDPFMGIGSTAYVALGGETQQGFRVPEPRNVVGFELKESYFDQCQRNIAKVIEAANNPTSQLEMFS